MERDENQSRHGQVHERPDCANLGTPRIAYVDAPVGVRVGARPEVKRPQPRQNGDDEADADGAVTRSASHLGGPYPDASNGTQAGWRMKGETGHLVASLMARKY